MGSVTAMETTTDHLLDGRVTLTQPRKGYRVAIDPVFLAAAVPARASDRILELGCGSGAAALCLVARVPDIHVTGLELQPEMVGLSDRNVRDNGREKSIKIVSGDVETLPLDLIPGSFDHVMTNPPYMAAGLGNPPPDPVKAMAMVESHVPLKQWILRAAIMVKDGGTLTVVHRADRKQEVVSLIQQYLSNIVVCPLWPGPDQTKPAKRILIQATTGQSGECRTTEGIILHDEDGSYTLAADQVLRSGGGLIL